MRKFSLIITGIICGMTISGAIVAETMPNSIGGIPIPTPPNNDQVMSTDSFKGTVDKYGSETTNKIKQTVEQQVKASAGSSSQTAPGSSTASPNQTNNAGTQNPPPADNAPAAAKPASPAAPNSSQPAPTTSDTYTGFGGTQSNDKSGNSGSSKSSNWNVGY